MYLLGRGLIGKRAGGTAGPSPKSQPSRCTRQHREIEKPAGRPAQQAQGGLCHRGVKVHRKRHQQRTSMMGLSLQLCQHYRYLTKTGETGKHQWPRHKGCTRTGCAKSGSLAARRSWNRLGKFLIRMAASVPVSSALFCGCNTFHPSVT